MGYNIRLHNGFRLALPALMAGLLGLGATAFAATPWPNEFKTTKGNVLTVYEPRLESLDGNKLTGNAACSIRESEDSNPVFGVFWFTATVKTDDSAHKVSLDAIEVTRAKFPDGSSELEKSFIAVVEHQLPARGLTWSTDWMNDALAASKAERDAGAKLENAPPTILVSTEPAVLIQFDGDPQLRPIEDSDLSRVVNTPYLVVYDPAGKNYYLGSDKFWYQSRDPLGPYDQIASPPSKILALKPKEAKAAPTDESFLLEQAPKVVTATKPTELIVFKGKPDFRPVGENDLLVVTNSDKDIFKDVTSQNYYVLLSGRWYTSREATGPWNYVAPERLPAGFAKLPTPEFARVLASVPGTSQADDAVLNAQVPTVTAVPKGPADFQVWYDEDPVFKKVKGTDIEYAVNASTSVFRANGKYYACDKGIWYISDGFDGPWYVSETRPEGLEGLPPDNPNYNTKYVYVYDTTPDAVYVGYTPGYLGCYPYHGAVYYGTGYWYDPWYGPAYYAYPWTWGLGVSYMPYGGWGFSIGFGTGFVNCGMTWGWGYYGYPYYWGGYYPYYGYGYCGGWYGPGGYYPVYSTPYRVYANGTNYGTSRQRTSVSQPQSIYAREATRYRKSAQYYDGAGSRQAPTPGGSQYRSRGGVATSPNRVGQGSPGSSTRERSSTTRGSKYSTPGNSRYRSQGDYRAERAYPRAYSPYRDRSAWTRPNGEPRGRAYDRSWTGFSGGPQRGNASQPRGGSSQYRSQGRATPGGQSAWRGSSGGAPRGGGGGVPRSGGGGGGGGRSGGGGGSRR